MGAYAIRLLVTCLCTLSFGAAIVVTGYQNKVHESTTFMDFLKQPTKPMWLAYVCIGFGMLANFYLITGPSVYVIEGDNNESKSHVERRSNITKRRVQPSRAAKNKKYTND